MIQFLAQTGPREVTHFIVLSRGNTERMHSAMPLRITPQPEANNIAIIAYESYAQGVLEMCTEGIIPVQQRDMLLKKIEADGLDVNRPSSGPGELMEVELVRVRSIEEKAKILIRWNRSGDEVQVEGDEYSHEVVAAIEEAAEKIANNGARWEQQDSAVVKSQLTQRSLKQIKEKITSNIP